MSYYLVDLEARILLTMEVEAEDLDEARSAALELTETPGLTRLDWDDEAVTVIQVRDHSGRILYGTSATVPRKILKKKGGIHDPGTKL